MEESTYGTFVEVFIDFIITRYKDAIENGSVTNQSRKKTGTPGLPMAVDEPTILVVDEADVTDLYATWLESSYDVRRAYEGHEALELLDGEVDVVLLDRRIPVSPVTRCFRNSGVENSTRASCRSRPSNPISTSSTLGSTIISSNPSRRTTSLRPSKGC
jgi:hypothetical protein